MFKKNGTEQELELCQSKNVFFTIEGYVVTEQDYIAALPRVRHYISEFLRGGIGRDDEALTCGATVAVYAYLKNQMYDNGLTNIHQDDASLFWQLLELRKYGIDLDSGLIKIEKNAKAPNPKPRC